MNMRTFPNISAHVHEHAHVQSIILRITGKKDYLGAYNSTDSQVDFKNYFGCDVPPAVMSTDILNFI